MKNSIEQLNLLINTTPMGMKNFPNLNIDIKKLKEDAAVFDLIYNPLETKLIKESKKRGIKNRNGLDMLIYQAQKSFYYWLNKTPKITNELKKIQSMESYSSANAEKLSNDELKKICYIQGIKFFIQKFLIKRISLFQL